MDTWSRPYGGIETVALGYKPGDRLTYRGVRLVAHGHGVEICSGMHANTIVSSPTRARELIDTSITRRGNTP